MKYVSHHGDAPLTIETGDKPVIGSADVLVQVNCFGINRADLLQRSGMYPPPKGESEILGLEVSGEVAALGADVTDWQLGDRVFGLVPGGGYGEYVNVPASHLMALPTNVSMQEGAGIAEVFLTAFQALRFVARLEHFDNVLIHAGASGVGLAAIQLAHLWQHHVVTTASSETKLKACRQAGADLAINYKTSDFVSVLRDSKIGIDVCIDMIGGDYLERNLKVMAMDGRIVQLAMMGGRYVPQLDMAKMLGKRVQLLASTLRNRSDNYKTNLIDVFKAECLPHFETGVLKANIDTEFGVGEVNHAHRRMQENDTSGKLVVSWQLPRER